MIIMYVLQEHDLRAMRENAEHSVKMHTPPR